MLRHLQERMRLEAEPCREHEAFGERQPVEAEDEVDGELGAPAVADAADVEIGREDRAQQRLDLGQDFGIAADQADALAAGDLAAGAGDRGLEQAQAARGDALAERGDAVGIAGAGAEHDATRIVAERGEQLVLDDLLDLVGAEDGEDDGAAVAREIGDGGRRGRRALRAWRDRRRSREYRSRLQAGDRRGPGRAGRCR